MAVATTSSPNTSPQRPKGLFLVTISEALVAGGDELDEQVGGGLGFEGDVADLVLEGSGVVDLGEPGESGDGGAELVAVASIGLVGEFQRMAVLAVGELASHENGDRGAF